MSENIFENNANLDALLRDIRRNISNGHYEMTPEGLWIGGHVGLRAGGVFDINAKRHIDVIRAMEEGDPEKEAWVRLRVLRAETGFETIDAAKCPNKMPLYGINFYLNQLVGASTKKTSWYLSAFRNDVTPDDTWDANWAGSGSGPKGQEINTDYVTASTRLAGTFGSASAKSITMATAVEYTVDTGVTGLGVYGGTLNSNSAFDHNTAYNGTNGDVLLAATRRASAITGLAAADKINLAYALTGSST